MQKILTYKISEITRTPEKWHLWHLRDYFRICGIQGRVAQIGHFLATNPKHGSHFQQKNP